MVPYIGNFAEDATVYCVFNTFTSDDPSASCTITDFINTDVHIHKDNDTTQRNNAAGITVSTNFDGITGSHMIVIDTSDDTVAGFWVTGHDYFVRIEGTTIDGATVNAFVSHFAIENRFNEVDVVKWLGQACHAVSENGVPKVDLDQIGGSTQSATDLKDFADAGYDPANNVITGVADGAITAAKLGADCITSAKIADGAIAAEHIANAAIDNATFAADVGSTAYATNIIALAVRKALDEINLDHLMKTAVANNADMTTEVADGTVLSNIMTKGSDTSDFTVADDSLEGMRDHIGDGTNLTEAGGDGDHLTEAGGDGDHLTEAGGDGDHLTEAGGTGNHLTELALSAAGNTAVINEFETQAAADPTGFKVNVMEVNGTAQTANDNGADINAILTDTNELQTDWVNGGRLDLILDAVLAMLDDARTEPGQGNPPVNPDAMTKIDYLYKAWRNKKDNDGSTRNLYADDAATVDQKSTVAEAAGTVTTGEWVSGP